MAAPIRVSVVVPVYNTEAYLERCVLSVVQQSYENLEIILVDDGSTDGSAALCRRWARADRRVRCVRQENAGLGPARNSGMEAADAAYITFLDADDWFEPTFIEKILGAMTDTGSDVGLCDLYYVDSASLARQTVRLRFDQRVMASCDDRSVLNKSRLFACGKIYRKALLRACDFRFPAIAYEDSCIPALIARANRVCRVPEPLFNYFRNRPGSLSNDGRKIADIGEGLALLRRTFRALGIYDAYALEYKKIALGQLRFACRKWGAAPDEGTARSLAALAARVGRLCPELAHITHRQVYAFGDQTLAGALDKALPYPAQRADDVAAADWVVAYANARPPALKTARLLTIPPAVPTDDPTSLEFNIAERIMEAF
jgi:glycosyltransferase involved in cell wall biosynthesis